jgi:CHASE2 domain-containing sensor protein
MASVYLADDEVLGETRVALKVLKQSGQVPEGSTERFLREVRLTYRIHHENVVRTFDLGQDGAMRFYTMEYLEGQTLASIVSEDGVSIPIFTKIAAQIARGLSAIHHVGVIHRDLKPDNIMLVDGMRVKITDFGIARGDVSMLTGNADQIVGTIAYLAPELLVGEQVTIAADYYSLGAVLYELLTGRHPIADEVPARLIMRKINEKPLDPRSYRSDIPDWIADGVMALLNPNPAVRSFDARTFVYRLAGSGPADPGSAFVAPPREVALTDEPTAVFTRENLKSLFLGKSFGRSELIRLCATAALVVAMLPLMFTTAAQKLEFAHLDNLFLLRGARPVSSDVVVVALDEVSYLNLQVPMAGAWPRDLHTKLLERLKVMGAKRVVFDILFVSGQSDRSSDERLAQSMRLIPTVIGAAIGTVQQATLNGTYTVEQMIRPDPIFQAAAAGIGMVTLPEVAGRVRSFYQHRSDVFTPLPSLAVAGAGVESSDGIPREGDLINFYGTSADLRRFSYADVVADENRIPSLAFKDKIVVIGLSLRSRNGPAQRDTFSSPFEPEMFGTDIHATAISNVLNKEWITRLSLGSDLVVFVFVATLLALLVSSLPVTLLLPVVIGCVAILAGAQFSLFLVGLFVPLVCSVVSGVVAGLIVRGGAAASTKSRVGRWI